MGVVPEAPKDDAHVVGARHLAVAGARACGTSQCWHPPTLVSPRNRPLHDRVPRYSPTAARLAGTHTRSRSSQCPERGACAGHQRLVLLPPTALPAVVPGTELHLGHPKRASARPWKRTRGTSSGSARRPHPRLLLSPQRLLVDVWHWCRCPGGAGAPGGSAKAGRGCAGGLTCGGQGHRHPGPYK